MSQWAKVQSLNPVSMQKIHASYGEYFPIEVRYALAQWIEERMGPQLCGDMQSVSGPDIVLDPDNPYDEARIAHFMVGLVNELKAKANAMFDDPYLIRIKLSNAAETFQQRLQTKDGLNLYRHLRHCMYLEQTLLAEENSANMMNTMDTGHSYGYPNSHNLAGSFMEGSGELGTLSQSGILESIKSIKSKTFEIAEGIRRMEQEQESFAIRCHKHSDIEGIINFRRMQGGSQSNPNSQSNITIDRSIIEQKNQLCLELKQRIENLIKMKAELEDKIAITVLELEKLQSRILDEELTKWKRDQQLAGNGAQLSNNQLDTLQIWCEDLAELIWLNRQQLKEVERLKLQCPVLNSTNSNSQVGGDRFCSLLEKVTQLLSSLVTSTFVVEKQPPQVMKTNTRFTATVRLLVGGRLNVHMKPPAVKVSIISEAQANTLLRQDKENGCESSGEILNNTGTMEYHAGTRHLSVHFRNMQLKRIKRAEKKGTESVMDEKFCLHFQCHFTVGEKELIFKIWTLSLPVVVIVHGNQEPHAWATVTWDNAFGESGRMPFQVPDKVPWYQVAKALDLKFKSMTGRGLTEDNLKFLAEKALRTPPQPNVNPSSSPSNDSMSVSQNHELLSWTAFCKEPLADRSFTFWEWLYAIMKLTREHLRNLWVDGSIIGFMGKNKAEAELAKKPPGVFILRFSDSELGGITIACSHSDQKTFSLSPFTSKDLATRSLVDRINDLPALMFLYPDIPKATAFGKYYTPVTESYPSNKGYVKPQLKTHIPGLSSYDQFGQANSPAYSTGSETPHTSYYNATSPQSSVAESGQSNEPFSLNNPTSPHMTSFGFGAHGPGSANGSASALTSNMNLSCGIGNDPNSLNPCGDSMDVVDSIVREMGITLDDITGDNTYSFPIPESISRNIMAEGVNDVTNNRPQL